MDAVQMLKERRSVRKYRDEKVDRKLIEEIIETATYAPTWANSQTARYNVIEDHSLIERIATESMNGFDFNSKTVARAPGVIVLSTVKGLSGYKPDGGNEIMTSKGDTWEMFDAGIAAQTLCLAAHEKGIGTVIMGIFDDKVAADILDLPENEVVNAIIPYGYIMKPQNTPPRKPLNEVMRVY